MNKRANESIDEEWTGYGLRQHLGIDLDRNTFRLRHNFSHSAYREMLPEQPFWSWQRFGRTSTALPDGRVIHIAGEHEDFYDPDFCIYNDVMVVLAPPDRSDNGPATYAIVVAFGGEDHTFAVTHVAQQ